MADEHKAGDVHPPPARVSEGAHIPDQATYEAMYKRSVEDPEAFWGEHARKNLSWFRDFEAVRQGSFEKGDVAWFTNGKINVSWNCLDRHIATRGDQTAIIFEGDELGSGRSYTYSEALAEVCKIANVLRKWGVRRGDTVAVYMPMIPDLAFVMLACARIGAVHSVVFAGFSANSLRDRIVDAQSKWVICADEGKRGGRTIGLKVIVDKAISESGGVVERCFMFHRTNNPEVPTTDIDVNMEEEVLTVRPYCPCEEMDSEDNLFLLYTSGSTGKPKGIAHTQAGYLLYTSMTHKYVFDYRDGDVYACVADCGWITGHSYIVYGPMCNGATTVMFESTPTYPDAGRYWDLIQRHKVTQFYTAPTAIRALMRFSSDIPAKYDLSSLRVLGSVGEPINPEAWRWYNDNIGKGRCAIVDTYWQTETGGIMLTPLPGATPTKPGACMQPFFGIKVSLRNSLDHTLIEGAGEGVIVCESTWPSLGRTVYNNHQRYLKTYMSEVPGTYFFGDSASRDADGHYWIQGRCDDVMNVSGHRLGSAEIESALVAHDDVSEAAVIGIPHPVKGEALACYVTLVDSVEETPEHVGILRKQVRAEIGPFATPEYIIVTPALPKTRSGKIMRRILRKLVTGASDLGDITTLADPSVVEHLQTKVADVLVSQAKK